MNQKQEEQLFDFLRVNHLNFAQMIRAFNFWNDISQEDRIAYVEAYMKKEIRY